MCRRLLHLTDGSRHLVSFTGSTSYSLGAGKEPQRPLCVCNHAPSTAHFLPTGSGPLSLTSHKPPRPLGPLGLSPFTTFFPSLTDDPQHLRHHHHYPPLTRLRSPRRCGSALRSFDLHASALVTQPSLEDWHSCHTLIFLCHSPVPFSGVP